MISIQTESLMEISMCMIMDHHFQEKMGVDQLHQVIDHEPEGDAEGYARCGPHNNNRGRRNSFGGKRDNSSFPGDFFSHPR